MESKTSQGELSNNKLDSIPTIRFVENDEINLSSGLLKAGQNQ